MLERVMAIVDLFVSEAHVSDAVVRTRSRLLVIMLLLVVLSVPFNMLQQVIRGEWMLLGVSTATWLGFSAALITHSMRRELDLSAHILLVGGWIGVLCTCLISGGLYSSVAHFFALLPIMALVLLGSTSSLRWTAASVGSITALALLDYWDFDLADPGTFMQPLPWSVNLILMLAYGVGLTWFQEQLRRQQQERLEEALELAAQANAAKSAFMANMSHELRTPMNGVLGMTELILRNPEFPVGFQSQLLAVQESGHALVELLNDILDLSKVETGKMSIEDIPWHPIDLVMGVQRLFQGSADAKRVGLELVIERPIPHAVLGDPMRVRQVLCNLVGNAVKFTDSGSIVIRLRILDEDLCVTVDDTGPGIPSEALGDIFEPFTQGDASTARRHGGTGLGLAISSKLAQLMRGTLTVSSEVGEGSTFRLCIPIEVVESYQDEPSSDSSLLRMERLRGMEVLLVEDVPVNQLVARGMLEALGCTVEIVEDGLSAKALLSTGRTWDVVLMDWHLPGMDGVEVARSARAEGYPGVIVAITASVRNEDQIELREAGMNGFLGKPYTQKQLAVAMLEGLHMLAPGL